MNSEQLGMSGTLPAAAERRSVVFLQIAVAVIVGMKLIYGVFVPPNGDEAYYWLWGGHLQLSYFDHSPLVGWTSAIARMIFGWTFSGLRFPSFVTFGVLIFTLYKASGWLAPDDPKRYFWTSLALFSASPLLNTLTTLNYPDHLLICFGSIALLYLGRFLNGVLSDAEKPSELYLGALFLGLAGLSKYSAVFIAAGLLVTLVAMPKLRRLFRSPHLYLAGALCLVVVSPVVIWNLQHHFATVVLHAEERLDQGVDRFTPEMLGPLLLFTVLEVSPFLILGWARFAFGRSVDPRQSALIAICRNTALISTLFFLPLATWGGIGRQVSPHWLVLSFVPFILVAPLYLKSRVLIALHMAWGTFILALITTYYLASPVFTNMLGVDDGEASRTYAHYQLGPAINAAVEKYDAALVIDTAYTWGSRLAFGMGSDEKVSDFGGRIDILEGREVGAAYAGKNMILVGSKRLAPLFDSVELIDTVETTRFGQPLVTYQLWLGRGFKPPLQNRLDTVTDKTTSFD